VGKSGILVRQFFSTSEAHAPLDKQLKMFWPDSVGSASRLRRQSCVWCLHRGWSYVPGARWVPRDWPEFHQRGGEWRASAIGLHQVEWGSASIGRSHSLAAAACCFHWVLSVVYSCLCVAWRRYPQVLHPQASCLPSHRPNRASGPTWRQNHRRTDTGGQHTMRRHLSLVRPLLPCVPTATCCSWRSRHRTQTMWCGQTLVRVRRTVCRWAASRPTRHLRAGYPPDERLNIQTYTTQGLISGIFNFFGVSFSNRFNPSVQCRCMASNSYTNEDTEYFLSQIAKEHLAHYLEGLSNKRRGQSQNLTTQYGWHTAYGYLDRRCTGRFRGIREVHIVREQFGGAQSTRTCWGWEITWEEAEVAAIQYPQQCLVHCLPTMTGPTRHYKTNV